MGGSLSGKTKQISRLIAAAQIEDVRLVETTARTRVRSTKDVGPVNFIITTSADVKERHKDGTFFVLAVIEAKVVSPKSREEPVVSVKAGFELKYKLPKGLAVTRRQLTTFAKINGAFNAWPYWREFIQSTVTRMNLPPIVLPLYRLTDITKAVPRKTSRVKAG